MDQGDLPTATAEPSQSPLPLPIGGEEEVVLTSWALLILVSLLLATLLITYALSLQKTRRSGFQHETIVALGMGAVVGLFVRLAGGESLRKMISFEHSYFFNLILPPIILNSGYDLKHKSFFRNFGTILSFAFVGTIISTFVIGVLLYLVVALHITSLPLTFLDCMIFGSILSSTDPVTIIAIFNQLKVDPDLFAIVFGESMLNDAVAIVLFGTLTKFQDQEITFSSLFAGTLSFVTVFSGSLIIGCIIALIASLALKHTTLYKSPSLESSIILLLAYSSYLLSNSIQLSGIIIVMISRYASTIPLSRLINSMYSPSKPLIPRNHQYILWWAGLRGAIAFALSFEITHPASAALRTTTLVVCVVSVVGLGGTIEKALEMFDVRIGVVDEHDGEDSENDEGGGDEETGGDEINSILPPEFQRAVAGRRIKVVPEAFPRRGRGRTPAANGEYQPVANNLSPPRRFYHNNADQEEREVEDGQNEEQSPPEPHWFIDFDNHWIKPLFTRSRRTPLKRRRSVIIESPTRVSLLQSNSMRGSSSGGMISVPPALSPHRQQQRSEHMVPLRIDGSVLSGDLSTIMPRMTPNSRSVSASRRTNTPKKVPHYDSGDSFSAPSSAGLASKSGGSLLQALRNMSGNSSVHIEDEDDEGYMGVDGQLWTRSGIE
ncbi:monovalent cation:H+ antiporter, CPA1 (nhx1) [Physocladia obscura]|uniref:Monovalent cation:H+ antiporter, CPA1 (Nhx1) n=1 Tax=Physocladia obscura TaxID=109957 RepID=A0AAD5T4X8_9FUNG|nr:monovalent cation:H+ antiporter, CPA1 (nhx1) [Physocladia obscura]